MFFFILFYWVFHILRFFAGVEGIYTYIQMDGLNESCSIHTIDMMK